MAFTHVMVDQVCVVRPGAWTAGTKMLEDLRKKGKVVTPKMEEMAKWMDSLDPGDAGGDVSWAAVDGRSCFHYWVTLRPGAADCAGVGGGGRPALQCPSKGRSHHSALTMAGRTTVP